MLKQNKKCSSKNNSYLLNICLKGRNAKITCCRWSSLSQKKASYMIPTMNCYPRNGQLRDPDFMRHILCHPNQCQYSQNPILRVVLNISKKVLRTRLIRVLLQHRIKQVGLTIHFKASLVRNSDNIKYKTQNLAMKIKV